jgi:nitroimidazol reductase NimA-like FMN-containing flavoprotein (pyridoxamine 5'-phosphate oxidase superfamily)
MNVARAGGTFDSESRTNSAHTMNDMSADGSGLEVLSDREAVALLATVPVGRLVYSDRAMPSVVPVVFIFDGVDIIIRTGRRSRLATLAPGNIVAFEVDDIAVTSRSGWTVVVTGRVELIDDRAQLERLSALRLQTWLPSPTDCYLRLRPELIAGRRIPKLAVVPA